MASTSDDLLSAAPGLGDGVRTGRASPLLGTVPGLSVSADLKTPPFTPAASDKTPANAADTKNFTPPASAPTTLTPLPEGQAEHDRGMVSGGGWTGPVTPDLALKAGFAPQEAQDWANLANWMTRGESARDPSAFTKLFNGQPWKGPTTDHPYNLGWSGDVYNGKPTSAAGLFQDMHGTWDSIVRDYLNGDKTFSDVNQVKGNLLMAADLYQKRTGGRNILADFKAGNVTSIASTLSDQWPTLAGAGRPGARGGDAAFDAYLRQTQEDIASSEASLRKIMGMANAADPMSDEMHRHLHSAISESEELSKRYRSMSEKPPIPKSPIEAAAGMAPLLMLFSVLGSFASKRPALAAMNAMSGALDGLKQGNDEQYSNNVNLWRTQTNMAKEAFTMQNTTIRNIMDDISLTDAEKQHKLQDAFHFWQMEQDLKLARENNWKEIWQRQDQREDKWLERQRLIAQTDKYFTDIQQSKKDIQRGSEGLTGNSYSLYNSLYDKFVEDNNREPTTSEKFAMKQQAIQQAKTVKGSLTSAQEQKNESIEEARKSFDWPLPDSFEDDVASAESAPANVMDDKKLIAKGYTPKQIALYKSLTMANLSPAKMAANTDTLNRIKLARTPLFKPPQFVVGEAGGAPVPTTPTGPATVGGTGFTKEELVTVTKNEIAKGMSREEAKAKFLRFGYELGLTETDFDAAFPPPNQTPTGPVGVEDLSPSATPGYIGLAPGI